MTILNLPLGLFALLFPFLCLAQVTTEIPTHFGSRIEEYLFFDNNFNVVQRLRSAEKIESNLMSAEAKEPVDVFLFAADPVKLGSSLVQSLFLESSDRARVLSSGGQVLIPCLGTDRLGYQALRLKFGAPVLKTTGRKVLSRATYFVEPVGSVGGFFAKFVPHLPGLEQKLEREILVNDYIKSQLSELPVDMQKMSMDSFMAVNLTVLGVPFSVAYRSADRILSEKPSGVKTYPGHGLLGCDVCLRDLALRLFPDARDESKAIDLWKTKELLPRLAKYMAYSHHVLGASFEAHTQNMVFDVDTLTGKIKDVYFRDFADVLLSPVPLLAEGRLPSEINWNRVKLLSIHGNYFSDQGTAVAKDIWYHASIYSGQGITSHITGFQKQQRHLRVFLEHYIAETERIMGQRIVLSEDAQKVMSQLEEKVAKENFYSGELQERSPLRNAMASVLKPILEQAFEVKIQKLNQQLLDAAVLADQEKVAKAFYKLVLAGRVVFFSDEARVSFAGEDTKHSWLKKTLNAYVGLGLGRRIADRRLVFKTHQDRVWAIDADTNRVMAASLESFNLQRSALERWTDFTRRVLNPTPNPVGLCRSIHN